MSEPVLIRNRPFWARILVVFWVLEVALGLSFAATGVTWIGVEENGMAAVLIICGLLLSGAGVLMTAQSWRIARLEGTAIEMTSAGLRDRRIAEVTVPWVAITWKVVFNSRAYSLQFDAAEPHGTALRKHWDQRAMGRFNRLFKYPEFTVLTLGTGKSAHEIGEIMRRYKSLQLDV